MDLIARISGVLLISVALLSCAKKEESSKITLQFPDVAAQGTGSSKALEAGKFASQFDWSRVCFIANVTASDIKKIPVTTTAESCEIPMGVFVGSVAPGGQVSLEIAKGTARKLEVFTFMRSSTSVACPTLSDGFGSLDRSKIVRVGEVTSFDVQAPEVDVAINVSAPATGESILTQYKLPASCAPVSGPPEQGGPSGIAAGRAVLKGGNFIVDGVVSGKKSEVVLTGGSFKVQMGRKIE